MQDQIRRLLQQLLRGIVGVLEPAKPQLACQQLILGPCSQFAIPCGSQACSPMAVLALASLLLRGGQIDIMHVMLEGTALYARMMDSAEDQQALMAALQLSLEPAQGIPTVEPASSGETGEGASVAEKAAPLDALGHWAPHSVADVVPMIERMVTGTLTFDGACGEITAFLCGTLATSDRGAALVTGGYTVAIARVGQRLYLFDSHGYHRMSGCAFCAVFALGQVGQLCAVIKAMMMDRLGEGDVVGFTTFRRPD